MDFLRLLEAIRTPFLDTVFQFFTFFGEEMIFMVIALGMFWCIDKKTGYLLLYVSFLGNIINTFLKLLFLEGSYLFFHYRAQIQLFGNPCSHPSLNFRRISVQPV